MTQVVFREIEISDERGIGFMDFKTYVQNIVAAYVEKHDKM